MGGRWRGYSSHSPGKNPPPPPAITKNVFLDNHPAYKYSQTRKAIFFHQLLATRSHYYYTLGWRSSFQWHKFQEVKPHDTSQVCQNPDLPQPLSTGIWKNQNTRVSATELEMKVKQKWDIWAMFYLSVKSPSFYLISFSKNEIRKVLRWYLLIMSSQKYKTYKIV